MTLRPTPFALLAALALAGCVVTPPPGPGVTAYPGRGKTMADFQQDEVVCRQYAQQQTGIPPQEAANQSAVGSAALGTALGAAAAAAIGAATGNPAAGAAIGAGSGLFLGAASGTNAAAASASSVQRGYDIAYAQCMVAHGNSVQQPQTVMAPATAPAPVVAYPGYAYPYPPPGYVYPSPYYYPYPAYGYGYGRVYWR